MKLPEFPQAHRGAGAEALTGGSPQKLHLKAIKNFKAFYNRLRAERGVKVLNTDVFRALKAEGYKVVGSNHYLVFDLVDKDGKFIERKVVQSDRTAKLIISQAIGAGYAVLHRGIYYIPQEVWEEYKARYEEVRKNPALSFEIFKLEKLVRLGDAILIDLDDVSEEDLKRFIAYLKKLGIKAEVWKSASGKGYHVYIHIYYRVAKVEDDKYYEFPYASDYRIKRIEEGLKEILRRLGIRYDSVSAKRAVWLEGVYNPLKGGKSEKLFNGTLHHIQEVYEKLRPLWEKTLKEKALKGLKKSKPKRGTYKVIAQIENETASNPIDYIQANLKNGTITKLLNRGLEPYEVGEILASYYEGDEKAFWRAWEKTEDFISATYKPFKSENSKRFKQRKHRHFWEYIEAIKKALEEGITTIGGISRRAKVPKTTVWKILQMFTREQILNQTDEVIAYLKANQKGGNRLSKERARQLGKERFEKYFEEFLKELTQKERKEGRGNIYPLEGNKGIDKPVWKQVELLEVQQEKKLDDKDRSNRSLSIIQNGRVEVGRNSSRNQANSFAETKLGTAGKSKEASLSEAWKIDKNPRFVKFYGKLRPAEEVKRIRSLVIERRINADSWELYMKAVEKLSERGVLVAETEETLELLGEIEKPLIGRKLLKLIKFLYAHKFHQVDLRRKPTLWEVLNKKPVKELNLGGWGRYAVLVYEVLLELGLIDGTTEVKFPKYVPLVGYEKEKTLREEKQRDLFGDDSELNLEELFFGEEEPQSVEEQKGDDDDDELYRLLFGED